MSNPYGVSQPGSVSSRFVSSNELSDAQKQREADLKAAYERIGQEPPPEPTKEEYDPRSLYERLQANKDAKQEKFEETWKLSNQFRGIDEGESDYLADVAKDKREEERKKRIEEQKEIEEFRKRTQAHSPPGISPTPEPSSDKSSTQPIAGAKRAAPTSTGAPTHKPNKKKRDGALLGIRKKPAGTTKAVSTENAAGKDESGKAADASASASTSTSTSTSTKEATVKDDK